MPYIVRRLSNNLNKFYGPKDQSKVLYNSNNALKNVRDMIKESKEKRDLSLPTKPDNISRSIVGEEFIVVPMLQEIIDLLTTNNELLRSKLELQSTDSPDIPLEADKTISQNIEFNDQDTGEVKTYNPVTDNSFYSSYNSETELGKFLSRPVLIHTEIWLENTDLDTTINPWELFFNDVRLKKKLDNFAFLSCNLKVKFMINASPFYYGCGLMSYTPLVAFNPANVSPGSSEQLFGVYSQRPHIYFYPQSNQGGELTLPYINYKDWLDISSNQDLVNFGQLHIVTLGTLSNANSVVGTGVPIQIYAWAEDVKLAGNTNNLALQSVDEYEDHNGIVSKPASAVAKVLGKLKDVPYIGPYCRVSEMIASRIGTVASWFGFTNIPVIDSSVPFSGKPNYAYCSPDISTPIAKLTMDPKNEVTIDSRVAGCDGADHMMIKSIVEREAFLFQTTFSSTDPNNTQIFASRVSPFQYNAAAAANQDIIQFTPMGHLSQMFKFWRGDIIYRIQFICSKYHRGRVRLSWDPVISTTVSADNESTNYTKIIDIAETPNFEIRVPYQQQTSYQHVDRDFEDEPPYITGSFALPNNRRTDNGVLGLRVLNQLTSPVANAPCLVFVSVRAADNFEFACPTSPPQDLSVYIVQSCDVMELQATDIPIESTVPETFFDVKDDKERNLVYMGEVVTSIRQLLRRKTLQRIIQWENPFSIKLVFNKASFPRLGYYPGFDPDGIHLAISPIDGSEKRYNFMYNTFLSYMRHCYIGNRGSINWTGTNENDFNAATFGFRRHNADEENSLTKSQQSINVDINATTGALLVANINNRDNMCSAGDYTVVDTWSTCDVAAPMYSKYRMLTNDPQVASFGVTFNDTRTDMIEHFCILNKKNSGTYGNNFNRTLLSQSIGADFSLIYYLSVPTFYRYPQPVAADVQPYFISS